MAKTIFQLSEASSIKVIDRSDKMILDVEDSVARPSDRILVTDTSGLSEDVRHYFLPLANQPAPVWDCFWPWVVTNKAPPGVHMMHLMPMEHFMKVRSSANLWMLRKRTFP